MGKDNKKLKNLPVEQLTGKNDEKELTENALEGVIGGIGVSFNGGGEIITCTRRCFIGGGKGWKLGFGTTYGEIDTEKCLRADNQELRKIMVRGRNAKTPQCGSCYHLEFKNGVAYCGKTIN